MNTQGYEVKKFSGPTKRYCQALNLKDDKELIEAYCRVHSKEKAWPEIRAGIREVGILEMEIYISGNQLFMIVELRLILLGTAMNNWLLLHVKPNGKSMWHGSNNVPKKLHQMKNGK